MRHASLPVAPAPPADEELARLIAAGDDAAFDELYRRYSAALARYAARMLRDPVGGEDVAQTSLLNAYQALRRGNVPEHFRSWVYRIARNAALEAIERRGDSLPLVDGDAHGVGDPMHAHTQRADLIAALRTLPERQRAVYVLRELKGMRVDDIGSQLGLATGQVEQAMFAARNRLAEQLEFGDRLDCASLRSLADARLTRTRRRAVKSHLRACAACRSDAPALRVGAFTVPALLDGVRAAFVALFGGGSAPIVAKAAAVVVAATAAGAAPFVVQHVRPSASTPQAAQSPSFRQHAKLASFALDFSRSASPSRKPDRRSPGTRAAAGKRAIGISGDAAEAVAESAPVAPVDDLPSSTVEPAPAAPEPEASPPDELDPEPEPDPRPAPGPEPEPARDPEPTPDREPETDPAPEAAVEEALAYEEPVEQNATIRETSVVDESTRDASADGDNARD